MYVCMYVYVLDQKPFSAVGIGSEIDPLSNCYFYPLPSGIEWSSVLSFHDYNHVIWLLKIPISSICSPYIYCSSYSYYACTLVLSGIQHPCMQNTLYAISIPICRSFPSLYPSVYLFLVLFLLLSLFTSIS